MGANSTFELKMGSFSFLILLIGAVASEPFFHTGNEYEFMYKGKMMTGIPDLDAQYSGLTLHCNIILQVLGSQKYRFAMRDVKYGKFNEKLSDNRDLNWRQIQTPIPKDIPSEFEKALESPIEFSIKNGNICEFKISEHEPMWINNLKKSLVSVIKIQLPSNQDKDNNSVRGTKVLPKIWEVLEDGVDGKCENTYQVNEIPESQLKELVEAGLVQKEKCLNKKVYLVLKTRDL